MAGGLISKMHASLPRSNYTVKSFISRKLALYGNSKPTKNTST